MKRSMRIGTKITVISCIAAVMAAISMALVTIIVFMSFVRTIQEDETATGINVLAAEVEGDIDEMGDVAELFVQALTVRQAIRTMTASGLPTSLMRTAMRLI